MSKPTGANLILVRAGAAGLAWAIAAGGAFGQAPGSPVPASAAAAAPANPVAPARPEPPVSAPPGPQQRPAPIAQVKPPATREELAAGNFTATRIGNDRYAIKVAGTQVASRHDVEEYMLYRAAEFAIQNKYIWIELIEQRDKGDKLPALKRDPDGPRFSYRLDNWRPAWRFEAAGTNKWQGWSPFSGRPFPVADGAAANFEVSAIIVLHKDMTDGVNPLAFEAGAVEGYLVNQVAPPK